MVVLSSFLPPQEGIRHEEPNTTVYINDREVGKGTFYITESVLSWVNNDTQQGFSLEYPHISLHAISRDEQVHPRQCLYVMVDAKVDLPDMPLSLSSENASENEDDDTDTPITEMQFAPDNTNNLESMFQAMNACQALHPDPQDSFSDEDIYEDAEEDYEGEYDEEVGAGDAPCIMPTEQMGTTHPGAETEEAMDVEAGQFEDAEEDP
ncbi:methylosome subunit pICln [Linepithema humile]|uniref:methylosome subunit pICln n=1 Tax=Linepithema humile TaxID=83485 RepID=UPI0006238CE8|nr:PREDICTED: methylosome subunit pICln [Linepithema humile]XP_012216925.1 PREDICTED: methylosome subunit pICln [Linepithema humile]